MNKEKLEVDYNQPNIEKEIVDWIGKTVVSAKVVHTGSEGKLWVKFSDGIIKTYIFNDLGFWDEEKYR